MESNVLTFSLPEEVKILLGEPVDKKVRLLVALALYREGKVSFGKAKELADVDTWEMLDILTQHGIPLDYTNRDLEEDVHTLKQVLKK